MIERHRKRVGSRNHKHIPINRDPAFDPNHAQPVLAFFNGHYHTLCCFPMAGIPTFKREIEQYPFCYVRRAETAPAKQRVSALLDWMVKCLRLASLQSRNLVRHHDGIAGPAPFTLLADDARIGYVFWNAGNKVLKRRAQHLHG